MNKKYKYLDEVDFPSDLKKLSQSEIKILAEELREEMIDAINLYLRSQDPSMPQSINISDVKGIDNLIERYKELIENHDNLENRFQKYRESQKIKNVQHQVCVQRSELTQFVEYLANKNSGRGGCVSRYFGCGRARGKGNGRAHRG